MDSCCIQSRFTQTIEYCLVRKSSMVMCNYMPTCLNLCSWLLCRFSRTLNYLVFKWVAASIWSQKWVPKQELLRIPALNGSISWRDNDRKNRNSYNKSLINCICIKNVQQYEFFHQIPYNRVDHRVIHSAGENRLTLQ